MIYLNIYNESEANNLQDEYDDAEGDYEHGEGVNALNLEYVRGYNKDIKDGVHNLTNGERKAIFYSAAHTGVIYDYEEGEQKLLQGHCNQITCTACSADKTLIVTADSGIDSMLVIWNSYDGIPIRTYFNPYENGICNLDISQDGRYLATISDDEFQSVSIWDLQNEELDEPLITTLCTYARDDRQHLIKFNPSDIYELVCHGKNHLAFLSWSEDSEEMEYYLSPIQSSSYSKKEKQKASFTSTVFVPDSTKAVTSTDKGDLLVWDISLIVDGMSHTNEKRLTKVLELHQDETAINTLTIHEYIITGNEDGSVRFYDFDLKICGWFENLDLGRIKSISFADEEPPSARHDEDEEENELKCADFIVADSNAVICKLESRLFEELEPDLKKGEVIFTGLKSAINCIAVHPHESILAIGGKSGFLINWNYLTKEEEYKQLKEEPCAIEYSPDGKYLMGGTADGLIRIYDPYNNMAEMQAP